MKLLNRKALAALCLTMTTWIPAAKADVGTIRIEISTPGAAKGITGIQLGGVGNGAGHGANSLCAEGSDLISCLDLVIEALDLAVASATSRGQDYESARADLREGLVNALNILTAMPRKKFPLVKDALQRGLVLDQQFTGLCSSETTCEEENRRAARFMGTFYEYVLNDVITLDRKYFVPSLGYDHDDEYSRGVFDLRWWNDFATEYRKVAIRLLELYTGGDSGNLPHALAVDSYETAVAENIFGWVAADITRDDFRRFYKYEYVTATRAKNRLAIWNTSGRGFETSASAVQYARGVALKIKNELRELPCEVREEHLRRFHKCSGRCER